MYSAVLFMHVPKYKSKRTDARNKHLRHFVDKYIKIIILLKFLVVDISTIVKNILKFHIIYTYKYK